MAVPVAAFVTGLWNTGGCRFGNDAHFRLAFGCPMAMMQEASFFQNRGLAG